MKKTLSVLTLCTLLATAFSAPALAQDWDWNNWDNWTAADNDWWGSDDWSEDDYGYFDSDYEWALEDENDEENWNSWYNDADSDWGAFDNGDSGWL